MERRMPRLRTRHTIFLSALMSGVSLAASGQNETSPTIDSVGNATVEAPPEYMEFSLTLSELGAQLARIFHEMKSPHLVIAS